MYFDVGCVLMDETPTWRAWERHLGVADGALTEALARAVARGAHHREAFEEVRPGVDMEGERAALARAGMLEPELLEVPYPDAAPCLRALRAAGLRVGAVGNMPVFMEAGVRPLFRAGELVSSSERWGVEKPAPEFFARVVASAGTAPEEIAYVGDRVDNDVLPALEAGMVAVHLRRGPWGIAHAERPEAARAHVRLDSLAELPAALEALR